jgi:uncharacterized protein
VEFTNEFQVPVDVETAFTTLTDLERVAPCLPGAQLEEVEGDTYTGRVKVKVGPIQVTYRGTAEVVDIDPDGKRAAIRAKGKETRGAGTAAADVVATLVAETEDTTRVTVVTDLAVTGKPAQFGRGVMADVGARIIDTFAERLEALLEEDRTAATSEPSPDGPPEPAAASPVPAAGAPAPAAGAPAPAAGAPVPGGPSEERGGPSGEPSGAAPGPEAVLTGAAAVGRRIIEPVPGREDDALDLVEVAGAATLKRLAPVVAVLAVLAGLLWWWRRR